MNIFNKLPTDIKCLIIKKVSQDNHKDLMKELTTHKDIVRCVCCRNPLIISLDIPNQLKSLYYEVEKKTFEVENWLLQTSPHSHLYDMCNNFVCEDCLDDDYDSTDEDDDYDDGNDITDEDDEL